MMRKILFTGTFMLYSLLVIGLQHNTDSLLQVLRTTDLPSDRITLLNLLAKAYTENDPIRAENYASQALLIAESIEHDRGIAEANFNLGVIAHQNNRTEESYTYFLKAEEGFKIAEDEKWLAKVNLYLSRYYKERLEYEKAIHLLFKSMETFRKLDKKRKLAETYNQIGGNYYDQGNNERAFEFYENSLEIYRDLDDKRGMAALFNNLGVIYRINNDPQKAINYFIQSMAIYKNYNLSENLISVYNNLGALYLDLDRLDSCEYYLQRSLELSQLSTDDIKRSSLQIVLGKYHHKLGNPEEALDHLRIGYDLAIRSGNTRNILEASEELSAVYLEQSEFEKAYNYFVQYRNNEDSLRNKSNLEQITRLEMNLIYDLENQLQEEEIQRVNLKYFTIGIVLVILIVLTFFLYGRQRIRTNHARIRAENLQMERNRLQEEIDYKNRELATNVMYLVKKNELINFITEKLLKSKTNFKPSIRKAVDEIVLDLQSNLDENIWIAFEERFREVHRNFYESLVKRFPKLTDNDRKLCAFIRLNMSTKEIAAITHQNPSSIEVARTRLRKKLNISNKDIGLNNFLSNL